MKSLWPINSDYEIFNPEEHTIAMIMSDRRGKWILPYIRQYKNLNNNQLLELIDAAKKNKWQALDLSACGLQELPDELWDLEELRILYIGNEKRKTSGEGKDNKITSIPQKIEKLKNLQALSISGLNCTINKESTLYLPNLLYLDIFDCGFSQIPNALLIPSLRGLGFNCLEDHLSPDLAQLNNLRELYLTFSLIQGLPKNIDRLQSLKSLYLWRTNIASLPSSMKKMTQLERLKIGYTPLADSIPPEILDQPALAIIKYVLSQQSNAPKEHFNESKVIIVGQGNVGKTSLMKRIIYDTFDQTQSTEGIDIEKWIYD